MHKILTILFASAAALVVAGCNGDDTDDTDVVDTDTDTQATGGEFALTLNGTGYDPHASGGHAVRATLFDAQGAEVATEEVSVESDGTFTVTFADALASGASYDLLWYADINGDDACQDPPEDHVWREALDAVSADVTVDHTHSTDDFATCAG